MKKIIILSVTGTLVFLIYFYFVSDGNVYSSTFIPENKITHPVSDIHKIKEGDIIFQASISGQSKAIQLATGSTYSHCGILFKNSGKYYVFEAIQPVKFTELEKWIARGENGEYVIKRLKNSQELLTSEVLKKMKEEGLKFKGKNYDLVFGWSDKKIYCSELVWKIYKRGANIELSKLKNLGDLDLESSEVQKKLRERYGDKIPMDEKIVSPADIFESDLLFTVK